MEADVTHHAQSVISIVEQLNSVSIGKLIDTFKGSAAKGIDRTVYGWGSGKSMPAKVQPSNPQKWEEEGGGRVTPSDCIGLLP